MDDYVMSWIEINQSAFAHNIQCYRQIIDSSVMLGVVVKSNAYGHGLSLVGDLCQSHPDISWLFTASLSEALTLRAQKVTKPILVLSICDANPVYACTHDIDLCVYSYECANRINAAAQKMQKKCRVHIKIDTGLSRFGFKPCEAVKNIRKIIDMPFLEVRGIFTHFAKAASVDTSFSEEQQHRFFEVLQELALHGISIPIRHAANSPASTLINLTGTNVVRLGAGAYGLNMGQAHYAFNQQKHPDFSLQQILNWYAKIIDIRTLPAGIPVSYDGTFVTDKETLIALIPVGYYEGYDRRLSNKGMVYLPEHDAYASVRGRVCMNHIIIDVSHIPAVQIGQKVLLCGDIEKMRAYDLACLIEGFNAREITTRLSAALARLPRLEQESFRKKMDIPYTHPMHIKKIKVA